jgi:hypothetical protein
MSVETFTRLPVASHIPVEFVEFIIAFLVTRSVIIHTEWVDDTCPSRCNLDIVFYLCRVACGRLFPVASLYYLIPEQEIKCDILIKDLSRV